MGKETDEGLKATLSKFADNPPPSLRAKVGSNTDLAAVLSEIMESEAGQALQDKAEEDTENQREVMRRLKVVNDNLKVIMATVERLEQKVNLISGKLLEHR